MALIQPTDNQHVPAGKFKQNEYPDEKNLLHLKKNIYIFQFIFIQISFNYLKIRHRI